MNAGIPWGELDVAAAGLRGLSAQPATDAETWERRWRTAHTHLLEARAENAQLRQALDDLNVDVEEFLSIAHQAGHEEAKSWLIRQQRDVIRSQRAQLRALNTGVDA